jgi:hypothetical protein
LVEFNAVMIGLGLTAGASREALVEMGWIPGVAILRIIALRAARRWPVHSSLGASSIAR